MSLPHDMMRDVGKTLAGPDEVPTATISIPANHPAAQELVELMNLLATDVRVGDYVVHRAPSHGGAEVVLEALRRAGYAKQVDAILRKVADHQENSDAVRRVMNVLSLLTTAQLPVRDAVKQAEEHFHEEMEDRYELGE